MLYLMLSSLIVLNLLSQNSYPKSGEHQFKQLEWLIGNWQRENVKPGRTAFETWKKESDFVLVGLGISMKGSDTTFVDKMRFEIKNNDFFYVAQPDENKEPTYFKITSLTKTGFVSENPDHDFPKKISYQFADGKLVAQISGGGKAIDFIFKRVKF